MSLYNMLQGINQATFFILPMLGKHPDEYPRFRDCFMEGSKILIYTRTGGDNRAGFKDEINTLRNMPEFITDYDDDFDSTYATWVFNIPEKWKDDFDKILTGNFSAVSLDYRSEMKRVFPKLTDKFEEIFTASNATN